MSCPTGDEVKSFIDFLRDYSKRNKNLTTVDCLRCGISEWQCSKQKQIKPPIKPIEDKRSRITSARQIYLLRSLSRIFGKKHSK